MSGREELLLARLREATLALRDTLDERDALLRERSEPIAIVGMGCRFPGGADDPRRFWELLVAGRDGVGPLARRWAEVGERPAAGAPRWAGLLTGAIAGFDPGFFGISPREAQSLDPQQRLLLEVGWEALEDAGIPPHVLKDSRTGVYVGATNTDYAGLLARAPGADQDAYPITGNLLSVAAGRLAYTWGLRGPCMTIDTVCSSSLVTVHLACQSLRLGESDLALAGGVNLILSAATMAGVVRTQALAPDGRCKTFDALANGFTRGEGCGVVVLKRLRDAVRDGDRVWATIRGSAINQDGASTGLTAPNVQAQAAMLRDALASARVAAAEVGFVETHGTGTSLGDPIEVEALREVLGAPRADGSRCVLGAVKTNLGHLEAAAGVAGLIKAALVLWHGEIPKNLNFRSLNPRVRIEGTALALATEATAWPRGSRPRIAGVSAFGMSGTNAHVILEEAPVGATGEASEAEGSGAELVVVSGKTAAALAAVCGRLVEVAPEGSLAALARSLATTRSPLEHRATIVATSRGGLATALAGLARGETPPGTARGVVPRTRGGLAFLFTGQGAQAAGMGRGLHAAWPAFRAAFDECAGRFDEVLPRRLTEVMWGDEAGLIDRTEFTQPALFCLQVGLVGLWRSWGVEPGLVAGHSIGELAAAWAAGVFDLADAVRLVAARGRLMGALPTGGAMVMIAADEAAVRAAIAGEAAVAIAAINGPTHAVIAGAEAPVLAIAAGFAGRGVKTRRLTVSHAFHSPLVEPMLAAFEQVAATVRYAAPTRALVSNVSGAPAGAEVASPGYWVRHARAAVRFADGVRALWAAGARTFVEV
ncbi:MAG: type I polyketide synthase, partial [Myxococcales bacterium]|nr:type I polyketide synthase [Myxococcales bacterium]